MGKLSVTEMVTVDGVAQAPYVNAEVENLMFAQASTMDALLLGRRTYEIFAARRQVEHRPGQGE